MLKKGMATLSRYPRLRVLVLGVGAVTIVGVSMHVFTKKQDISKTPQGPVSHVATKPVPLKGHRMVGDGKQYGKLKNKYDQDQYNNKLRHGDTIMPGDWFNKGKQVPNKDQHQAQGSNDKSKGHDNTVIAAHAHKQEAAPAAKNNEPEQKAMMSPGDFQKAAHEAERLPQGAQATGNTALAQRSPQGRGSFNNWNSGRNGANNARAQFHPDSYHPPVHNESPQEIQQHQQNVSSLASKMQGQLSSMGSSWNMPVASQATVDQKIDPSAVDAQTAAQKAAENLANPPQIIKAATVYFAIIKNKVSSDQPNTPVMAKLITGPYKGSKLLGGFYTEKDKLLIKFNTMVMKSRARSFSVGTTYAIDTKDGQTAVETDVNHHYLLRYGSLFAASFLEGLGQAYTPNTFCYVGINGMTCPGGMNDVNPNQVNTKVALMRGAGKIGSNLGQHIGNYFNTPPTVTVAQGTLVGILFMNDVSIPKMQVVQTDPDYSESAGTDLSFLSDDS
jgi:hypothetical protein